MPPVSFRSPTPAELSTIKENIASTYLFTLRQHNQLQRRMKKIVKSGSIIPDSLATRELHLLSDLATYSRRCQAFGINP